MVRVLDEINEWSGKIFTWVIVPMTLLMVFEVFMRRVLGHPTIWTFDVTTHIYGLHFIMLAGYTLLHKGHVGVDVVSSRFSTKIKAIVDVVTYLCFFFPWIGIMLWQGAGFMITSWARGERAFAIFSIPLYPLKTALFIGFLLLLLEGIATFAGSVRLLLSYRKGGEKP